MIERLIRRPVAVLMATAALAALGIPSALRMPLELLPDVTFPRLAIQASWPGASPEMVEARVTAPVERAAQRVRGVASVASTSYPQRSEVTVEFEPGTDMEFARLALSEELAAVAEAFPPGASRPGVQAWVPEEFAAETQALLDWMMDGPGEPGDLRDLAMEVVRPALLAVDGVDAVQVAGGTDRELRVDLDPDRLAALGISPGDVTAAIASGLDVSETAATVEERGRAWTVTVEDRAGSAADVEALVVRPAAVDSVSGVFRPAVLLGELGRARVERARPSELRRVDGRSAVTVSLHRAAGSNAVRVAGAAREQARALEAEALPTGHRLLLDRDGSERIRDELSDLGTRAAVAAAVVLAVLLVAFRRVRPALLAFGAIGASVAIALAVMGWSGLTLNLLTLAGLAMGLGLVVDNAIVVLESGERRCAAGEAPAPAAAAGAREVALPLVAATATTAIVFLPFLYFQGELRAYYVPFAATVAVVLAVSLAVSLLAVPAAVGALAARTLKNPGHSPTAGQPGRAASRRARPGRPTRFYRAVLTR
ncbi:MAG TPA: efflux RND transporter permease subunit, partial [Gemmatimonadota bacterium]|nr:efflux RND transporter permease subunit [Gemmatimonadota bacterium]